MYFMRCRHNWRYTQGYFFCKKCGKRKSDQKDSVLFKDDNSFNYYFHSPNRKKNTKKAIIIFSFILLFLSSILFLDNTGIEFIDNINVDSVFNLHDSFANFQDLPIPNSESITNMINNSISKVISHDTEINIPIRLESGFDTSLIEDYVYEFTNKERQKREMPSLDRTTTIDSIARNHSLDMSNRNYFDHVTPEGLDPTDRGIKAGYDCRKQYAYGLAENIYQMYTYSSYTAWGDSLTYDWFEGEQAIAKELIYGWMYSPGHRENILNKSYDRIGVGVIINSDEEVYATQNFC